MTGSEADGCGLFGELRRRSKMTLITECRNNKTESGERQNMSWFTEKHKSLYRERSCTAEPMRGPVKDISDLNGCPMRGNSGNRRLSAATGLAVRMYQFQLKARRENRSAFKIRDDVLG